MRRSRSYLFLLSIGLLLFSGCAGLQGKPIPTLTPAAGSSQSLIDIIHLIDTAIDIVTRPPADTATPEDVTPEQAARVMVIMTEALKNLQPNAQSRDPQVMELILRYKARHAERK